jgi:hypothetical protein
MLIASTLIATLCCEGSMDVPAAAESLLCQQRTMRVNDEVRALTLT